MKPYTLEWWINRIAECLGAYQFACLSKNKPNEKRYADLAGWIKARIIKKYGQQ